MKPIEFMGDSLARVREFPKGARRAAGYQLDRVQRGLEPRRSGRAFASCASATARVRFV